MIYLTRTTTDRHGIAHTAIAACETVGTTERAEARGFVRCSQDEWMAGWQRKDWLAMIGLAWAVATEPAPLTRVVGATLN